MYAYVDGVSLAEFELACVGVLFVESEVQVRFFKVLTDLIAEGFFV